MSELFKDDNMMADEDITVIKRNGDHVSYNRCKIRDAVLKAYNEKYPNDEKNSVKALTISWFADTVIKYHPKTKETKSISVEDIQDIVEEILTTRDYKVGRAYIRYRHKRETARNTTDESILELIRGESEYWQTENSNKDADNVTTQRDYIAGITSKDITRRFLLPSDVLNADEQGIIHFHDSDYFIQPISNCSLPNLGDMLQYGTVINKKMIEKPHRVLTCSTISTQIITAVASSQYGGTTINLSDMAPFVRSSYEIYLNKYKDYNLPDDICESLAKKDLAKEVEDAVQTFNYQINSMSTTNGQTPFISVFMHINDNPEYAEETAMLIHEFIKQRIQGMKNEEGVWVTQEFPKLLYVLEEDNIRPDSKYYYITELAAECNIKRLAPDYISKKKLKELKSGDVYGCMGCRSFLTVDRFSDSLGNIAHAKNYVEGKHKYWGRFNQGVVTISLPDVAFSSGGDIDKFWKLMDERTELCHKALRCRHERLEGTLSDVAPILWQHGAFARLKKGEKIDELLHHGYSTISLGYAGLYECVKYMTGHSHTDGAEGEAFGIKVMEFLNAKCAKWRDSEDIDYSLYGTPIESTTYKFAKCLKKRFGDDVFEKLDGIDRNYITNSYHVPVFEKINPFDKLSIESKFQELSPGGAVSYVEAADLSDNPEAIMEVIKFIYENILYAEINVKSDYCMVCGWDKEIEIVDKDGKLDWRCPNCGNMDHSKMSVARRTCGYIGANFWNEGRTNEIKDRVVHLDVHEYNED